MLYTASCYTVLCTVYHVKLNGTVLHYMVTMQLCFLYCTARYSATTLGYTYTLTGSQPILDCSHTLLYYPTLSYMMPYNYPRRRAAM